MANQTGIAITIRAFLPTGKTLDEQFTALSIVKTAHETGDYAPLLAAATVDDVKTEQRTRRVDETAAVVRPADDTAERHKPELVEAGAQPVDAPGLPADEPAETPATPSSAEEPAKGRRKAA